MRISEWCQLTAAANIILAFILFGSSFGTKLAWPAASAPCA